MRLLKRALIAIPAAALVALAVTIGCAARRAEPQFVGMPVGDLERSLGFQIASWGQADAAGYSSGCDSTRTVTILTRQGTVCVVRRGDRVAAMKFRTPEGVGTSYGEFRQDIIAAYELGDPGDRDIYSVRTQGVVRLLPGTGLEAQLVVTDAEYGKHYSGMLLREGFSNLVRAAQPR